MWELAADLGDLRQIERAPAHMEQRVGGGPASETVHARAVDHAFGGRRQTHFSAAQPVVTVCGVAENPIGLRVEQPAGLPDPARRRNIAADPQNADREGSRPRVRRAAQTHRRIVLDKKRGRTAGVARAEAVAHVKAGPVGQRQQALLAQRDAGFVDIADVADVS